MSSLITACFICTVLAGQIGFAGGEPIGGFFVVPIDAIDVPAKEAGALWEVLVEEGDRVRGNQRLAQVDDKIARLQIQVARSKLKSAERKAQNEINRLSAKAQTEVYRAEFDTARTANEEIKNTFSVSEVRRRAFRVRQGKLSAKQAEFEQSVAMLDAATAETEMQQAIALAEQRKIKSPVFGIVNRVYVRAGNWVNIGDPVIQVVRMDQLRVKGTLDHERFSPPSVRGKTVTVTVRLAGGKGNETVTGKIGHASPIVNTDGEFEVWVQIQNRKKPDGGWLFTPGLDAAIRID